MYTCKAYGKRMYFMHQYTAEHLLKLLLSTYRTNLHELLLLVRLRFQSGPGLYSFTCEQKRYQVECSVYTARILSMQLSIFLQITFYPFIYST